MPWGKESKTSVTRTTGSMHFMKRACNLGLCFLAKGNPVICMFEKSLMTPFPVRLHTPVIFTTPSPPPPPRHRTNKTVVFSKGGKRGRHSPNSIKPERGLYCHYLGFAPHLLSKRLSGQRVGIEPADHVKGNSSLHYWGGALKKHWMITWGPRAETESNNRQWLSLEYIYLPPPAPLSCLFTFMIWSQTSRTSWVCTQYRAWLSQRPL